MAMLLDKILGRKILLTHDGKFHADDVMATAVLNLVYKGKIRVIRTREYAHDKGADIIYDWGHIYDPAKNCFDHHQTGGADTRPDGVPYAAFGLIWRHFGLKLVDEKVHKAIDEEIVRLIDAEDVAYDSFYSEKLKAEAVSFDAMCSDFVPADLEPKETYRRFMILVEFATKYLRAVIEKYTKKVADWDYVEKKYNEAPDKRVIVLERHAAWARVLMQKPEPLYVIFPDANPKNNNYKISAVGKEVGKYGLRITPPVSWLGKEKTDLEQASGVPGAIFCHNSGFLMVADSLKSAEDLVQKIIN